MNVKYILFHNFCVNCYKKHNKTQYYVFEKIPSKNQ